MQVEQTRLIISLLPSMTVFSASGTPRKMVPRSRLPSSFSKTTVSPTARLLSIENPGVKGVQLTAPPISKSDVVQAQQEQEQEQEQHPDQHSSSSSSDRSKTLRFIGGLLTEAPVLVPPINRSAGEPNSISSSSSSSSGTSSKNHQQQQHQQHK